MESSSSNILNWLFGQKQNTAARDPLQCVPQSSSDSPKTPSPRGLVVSLELEQRISEASAPAEAERSSPSDEDKAKSNAAADNQLTDMVVGRNESDNDCDREKEDCSDCIKNEGGSTSSFIHAAPINIKTAEVNAQEKEGFKDTSGKAEFQTAKMKVEEKEESEENLLQDQCRAKERILEEKEEYVDKPTQNEEKGAEPGLKGKEISKEMPGQTEDKAKLKVKEDSEDDPRQTEFVAGKLMAQEKEEPLITGKAQCKAVKLNMKEKDGPDPEEDPAKPEVKAAKKKVKKKVESKVEPTQTKLQGSFGGVEAERGSNGEVDNARTEVGGKQTEEEKASREGEEDKAEVWSDNTIGNETEKGVNEKKEEARGGPDKHTKYPVRPEAEDCAYYMKTWTCKFGSNCKFNHPVQKKHQAAKQKMKEMEESKEKSGQTKSKLKKEAPHMEKSGQTKSKATKEKVKEKTDAMGNTRQFECKFYSSPEGCKLGKGCKFSHKKTNYVPPPVGFNFMGLPMRPGVKDCTYFMLTATCMSDVNCKFNHPDPTLVIDDEPPVQERTSSQSTQQSAIPIESTPFVSMEYSAYNTEWSLNEPPSPAFTMQSPTSENCMYASEEQWAMNDIQDPDHLGQSQHGTLSESGDCDLRSNNNDNQHENPKLD